MVCGEGLLGWGERYGMVVRGYKIEIERGLGGASGWSGKCFGGREKRSSEKKGKGYTTICILYTIVNIHSFKEWFCVGNGPFLMYSL